MPFRGDIIEAVQANYRRGQYTSEPKPWWAVVR